MDVDVAAGSSMQFKRLLVQHGECDLVILEVNNDPVAEAAAAEQMRAESNAHALLVILDESSLADFRLPMQVKSDFVVRSATPEECSARIRQLLWPGNENSSSDYITIDNMTLNLAT